MVWQPSFCTVHSNFRTGPKWPDFNLLTKLRAKRLHSPQGVTHSFLGERGDVKAFGYRKKEGALVGGCNQKYRQMLVRL